MSADQATGADRHYDYDIATDRRRAAAASLHWRSRIITAVVWTCAAVAAALLITFLVYSGVFESGPENPVVEPGEISESATVGDLKFTGFDRKNQAYAITADGAEQDEEQPNVIYLDKVRAEMKLRRSGDVIFVTADRGTYDTEAETVLLETNVKLKSTSGYTAELNTADIALKDGRVRSDDPVVVSTSRGTIWANALEMWDKGKRVLFKNRIRVLFEPKDKQAEENQSADTKEDAG